MSTLVNDVANDLVKSPVKPSKDIIRRDSNESVSLDITKIVKPSDKPKTELQLVNEQANVFFSDSQFSLSAAFKLLRAGYKHVELWCIQAANDGKDIDTAFIHDVINLGNLGKLMEKFSVKELEKRLDPKKNKWTVVQLFAVVKRGAVIKPAPKVKK